MRARNAVPYVAATLAALACLYGCGAAPFGASDTAAARHADPAARRGATETSAAVRSGPGPGTSAAGPARSVRVTLAGDPGQSVSTTSGTVIATVEGLLHGLPAAPARARRCPAVTQIYLLTLQPARPGQPVVISTGGCQVDDVSVGGRPAPPLWDARNRIYLLARALLRPRTPAASGAARPAGTGTGK
jgi:hypothetical protein